jgi:hypothetical protein
MTLVFLIVLVGLGGIHNREVSHLPKLITKDSY